MKIVEAINAMITNSKKISNVIKRNKEYYFLYDNKFKWSINSDDQNQYFLFLYPDENMSLEQLSVFSNWSDYSDFVTYKSSEINTREALESFSELYQIVSSKSLGVDKILDEIIGDDFPF